MAAVDTKNKTLKKTQDFIRAGYIEAEKTEQIDAVAKEFSFAMTATMQQQATTDAQDPVAMQFVPHENELTFLDEERVDPIGDETHTKVKGIIHRYPDRCLFKPVNVCPVYCRFCFRREKVGPGSETLTASELDAAFEYIRQHPEIWEVIITGGDPLILKPKMLEHFLKRLDEIDSVAVVRLHTRVPIVDPERMTNEMLNALELSNKACYLVIHANHANEFSSQAQAVCKRLVQSGVVLLGQSVLLKGINDNIDALSDLMRTMIRNRIKPYYLHHADLAKGTSHFRTTIKQGQDLMQQLRGRFSGICQPTYVLDIPGGHGKVPIHHNYVQESESCYCIEDYRGQVHAYRDE